LPRRSPPSCRLTTKIRLSTPVSAQKPIQSRDRFADDDRDFGVGCIRSTNVRRSHDHPPASIRHTPNTNGSFRQRPRRGHDNRRVSIAAEHVDRRPAERIEQVPERPASFMPRPEAPAWTPVFVNSSTNSGTPSARSTISPLITAPFIRDPSSVQSAFFESRWCRQHRGRRGPRGSTATCPQIRNSFARP
jgi:hypothetical protein